MIHSRIVLSFYGCVYKILRFVYVKVEFSVVVVSADFSFMNSPVRVPWKATFPLSFYEICVEKQWEYKICDAISGLRDWRFEFNYH